MTYPNIDMLIDGRWIGGAAAIPVFDPATESIIGHAPAIDAPTLAGAVAAAARGFSVWRDTPPAERCRIMLRATDLIRARREEIAATMTLEQGKPIVQARAEVDRAADILAWDANEGLRVYGRIIPAAPGLSHSVLRRPIGPVAAFSPWNFPASSPARKIGGALAAGCSIILKPSEETPGTAVLMAHAFQEAGLPPGVLNLVFGDPAHISETLIARPEVRLVTFTGSIPVGKHLAALASAQMKPTIMELGGHGPVIICKDADIERAARLCVTAKARNAGQVCVAPTRFLVEAPVHATFVDAVLRHLAPLVTGNGMDEATDIGPLANARRITAMEEFVSDATERGAELRAGGARIGGPGLFFPLTVLDRVPLNARAMHEEIFGPIMAIRPVADIDEAIKIANATDYALAAYAFTGSARIIDRLGRELECGNLAVNHMTASFPETPFGGEAQSGHGREGGTEGLDGYTVTRLVSVDTR
ncbi:NAD-dependent succinate-semialdehyde dehydrogenase [Roseovarius sp. A46]|uniref:NAD-dependent succinate-semialdehyde dehydrogenase n=1 Tax=Roseovarius sp. A46 TaxID=2109331 RepID=UPI001010F87C|nr:NAD-dependent succinate-semialdehyde dehydrogenase [Roseovarius sp. A46]RXV59871.1 NAD-dependent succinate-semialdehyde dehydrogenase [Roseovarius sp. A46]